ncbi:ABC transporter ATP-binding protein [Aeoliella mucimassa]|uniref:Putative ABC transporter ATP-binding protein YbhF n=1 Tax=Aeoliella mucimassa TaxID=2527972 RepID=A0A518AP10_9BACT|nr:ABC transporter ATP-binding protein [Aeoliella mucimassa]QDU56466.1 putative ABC transporter ATP-binding protein YbhF [Aeoliella mucimassa]
MASIVTFQAVGRDYGTKRAVDDLNLDLQTGELFALLGHNGAGKTTTIKMLVGLLRPQTGTVTVGGYDLVKDTRDAVSLLGYVPDQPYLYDKLSGREFLDFIAGMYGYDAKQSRTLIEREIERFGLASFVDDLCESYSHGMKQRTVFAAAMLHNPSVLVIDEPLVGLDPQSIRLVKDLLRTEVSQGLCVFMSTHTLAAAEEIADRIGVMRQSKLLFTGTVDELRDQVPSEQKSLESLYLHLMNSTDDQPFGKSTDAAAEPGENI